MLVVHCSDAKFDLIVKMMTARFLHYKVLSPLCNKFKKKLRGNVIVLCTYFIHQERLFLKTKVKYSDLFIDGNGLEKNEKLMIQEKEEPVAGAPGWLSL